MDSSKALALICESMEDTLIERLTFAAPPQSRSPPEPPSFRNNRLPQNVRRKGHAPVPEAPEQRERLAGRRGGNKRFHHPLDLSGNGFRSFETGRGNSCKTELEIEGDTLFGSAEVFDEMLCQGFRFFQGGKHVRESKKVGLEAFVLCALGDYPSRPGVFVEQRWDLVSNELKKPLTGSSDSRFERLVHGTLPKRFKKHLVEHPIIGDNKLYINNLRIEELRIEELRIQEFGTHQFLDSRIGGFRVSGFEFQMGFE
jgi:hypothetical protein